MSLKARSHRERQTLARGVSAVRQASTVRTQWARVRESWSKNRGLAIAVTVAAALRVPWLGAIPSPAGDEGNWALTALALSRGHAAGLSPDAGFVSLFFAHSIAISFRIFDPSFSAARAVLVAGAISGLIAVYFVSRPLLGARSAALMAFALAVHPWSVAWSRTVSVPYALALPLSLVGVLSLVRAVHSRHKASKGSVWSMALGFQCLGAGLHISPLGLIPWAVSLTWLCLPGQRDSLRRPSTWLSAALGSLHAIPMISGIFAMPPTARQPGVALSPSALASALRAMLGQLDGQATVNHFVGAPPFFELTLGLVFSLFFVSLWRSQKPPRRPSSKTPHDDNTAPHTGDLDQNLSRLALVWLAISIVALPAMLVPARAWSMPTIDSDRYGFVLVAPFVVALGATASRHATVVFVTLASLSLSTVFMAARFTLGGGPDKGLLTSLGGGNYRGWRVPRERRPLAQMVHDTVSHLGGGVIAYDDYAFHVIRFVNSVSGDRRITHSLDRHRFAENTRVFVLVWSPGLFSPGYAPAATARYQLSWPERYRLGNLHRVYRWVQPDGSPLCELWLGTATHSTTVTPSPSAPRSLQTEPSAPRASP